MFFLRGIPLCFRRLQQDDLKYSYYNLMNLLSNTNIDMINELTEDKLFEKLDDDHHIFVIINENINMIVGTATIYVLNKNTQYTIVIIKEIKINKEYEKKQILYTKFVNYLIEYSFNSLMCVKYLIRE
tara:strand:+ start:9731 stop:10114 length:384 start_codon:yes stop_codon:yes gene_type:complete